jgi:tetratricopeptide (TPR) repeat protein
VEIEPTSLVEETPEPVEAGDVEIPRPEVELEGSGAGAGPVDGLMGSAPDAAPEVAPLDFEPAEAPLDLEPAEPPPEPEVPAEIPFLGVPELEPAAEEELPAAAAAGLDVPELDLGGFGEEAGVTIEVPPEEAEPVALELNIEVGPLETGVAAGPPDIKTLEAKVANNPDDAQLHQALGEALLELGQRERALEELDIALGRIEAQEDWVQAEDLADEILRLDPNSVRHHQKRVEYAFRRNDKGRLVEAYLGLSDGLMRSGALERARAVYQRVLEHDPQNPRALSALSTLEPAPEERKVSIKKPAAAAPTAAEDFVDLGSFILEEPVRLGDARLRVQDEEPTGDEQRDFEDMLTQFKKGIEASLGAEDVQAHYDLGVAFKEMGLLDEAIGEFQKALRGTEGRLRTSEALGTCFFEKRQFNVAATVLRRAVETDQGGDEAKIGLLYWLGRCEEEMGRPAEALGFYQRVFAVDIGFQDVSDRVASLAKVGR